MKRILSLLLSAIFILAAAVPAFAEKELDPAEKATAIIKYYRDNNLSPATSEETLIFAATYLLTEKTVPYQTPVDDASSPAELAKRICETIAEKKDPANADGQNFTGILVEKQQADGSFDNNLSDTLFSVIALQAASAEYDREKALTYILSCQKEDGSFSFSDNAGDEITATAFSLCVLSIFRHETKTNYDAAARALTYLEENQNEDGGFSSSGVSNCLETSYALLAATDMEALSKENWKNALKALAEFANKDGSYSLVKGLNQKDPQSTVLALMAFEAARYGASVYKTLATNKTIAPSFSLEHFKPLLYVFAGLAGLSVIFWIAIFVRKPKTRTLKEVKEQTDHAVELAEQYIRQQQEKEQEKSGQ